jgi:hypothetical protein
VTDYDFRALDDKEFEIFCCDLLGDVEGVRFERFKGGRDAGVDGRFFAAGGEEVILQCKHRAGTPIKKLTRLLKNEERPKVERLHPGRYLLALSNPLSRANKTALVDALQPYLASPRDIFGREDLNELLAKRPHILRRHYKLWLFSADVLSHVLNKSIFERSHFSLEDIRAAAGKYVRTANHELALEKLARHHVVIITGEPGIGKTILGEHLCLHYVAEGFQFFRVAEEIRECEEVFQAHERQIFYFDDFLGRNYLEALSGHEGNHIVQFMRRVKRDSNKRFVLTSRSTILNQGKLLMDALEHQKMHRDEFELRVDSLTDLDKARILYSHLWHSQLPREYGHELRSQQRYRSIIEHRNYNPRLISFITDADRLEGGTARHYLEYVFRTLDNPAGVWEHSFGVQLDACGRALVLLVTLNRRPIEQNALAESYARYTARPENAAVKGRHDFISTLKHLTGSFLARTLQGTAQPLIDLFNPSIGDFVLRRYADDLPSLRCGFLSLRSASSLQTLMGLHSNKIISKPAFLEVLRAILSQAHAASFAGFETQYVAAATIKLLLSSKPTRGDGELGAAAVRLVLGEPISPGFADLAELVRWGQAQGLVSAYEAARFVIEGCAVSSYSNELTALSEVAYDLDGETMGRFKIEAVLRKAVSGYLADNLSEEIQEAAVFERVELGDASTAEENLRSEISDWTNACGVELNPEDVDELVSGFDVESRLREYQEELEIQHDYSPPQRFVEEIDSDATSADEIDDLFDAS